MLAFFGHLCFCVESSSFCCSLFPFFGHDGGLCLDLMTGRLTIRANVTLSLQLQEIQDYFKF